MIKYYYKKNSLFLDRPSLQAKASQLSSFTKNGENNQQDPQPSSTRQNKDNLLANSNPTTRTQAHPKATTAQKTPLNIMHHLTI